MSGRTSWAWWCRRGLGVLRIYCASDWTDVRREWVKPAQTATIYRQTIPQSDETHISTLTPSAVFYALSWRWLFFFSMFYRKWVWNDLSRVHFGCRSFFSLWTHLLIRLMINQLIIRSTQFQALVKHNVMSSNHFCCQAESPHLNDPND